MKRLIVAFLVAPVSALAHDSLAPHRHPHGPSLLPESVTLGLAALFLLGVWLVARWYFKD